MAAQSVPPRQPQPSTHQDIVGQQSLHLQPSHQCNKGTKHHRTLPSPQHAGFRLTARASPTLGTAGTPTNTSPHLQVPPALNTPGHPGSHLVQLQPSCQGTLWAENPRTTPAHTYFSSSHPTTAAPAECPGTPSQSSHTSRKSAKGNRHTQSIHGMTIHKTIPSSAEVVVTQNSQKQTQKSSKIRRQRNVPNKTPPPGAPGWLSLLSVS